MGGYMKKAICPAATEYAKPQAKYEIPSQALNLFSRGVQISPTTQRTAMSVETLNERGVAGSVEKTAA